MSQKLYGRIAILDIGIPGQTGKRIRSFYIDEKTKTITNGLRFTFKIEKTSESTPNKASLSIYNVAKETIDLLKRPKTRLILSAGYGFSNEVSETTAEVIFTGDGAKTKTTKEGPDFVTTIEFGDGLDSYSTSKINTSLAAGASGETAISQVISAMGLKTGEIKGASSISYTSNLVLSGNAKDAMDDITEKGDLEWSIQDEEVQVIPINGFNSKDAIFLSDKTGLIGSPSRTGFNQKSSEASADNGVEFTSLLQPGLVPGRRVSIESKNITGVFVVRKVNIEGDTYSGPWFSKCEAIPI